MGSTVSALTVGPFVYKTKTVPDKDSDPTFDPQLGFEGQRKERVMLATEEAMISAKIPKNLRNYCAHLLINFEACKRDKFPLVYRCKHEKHEYEECMFEDHVIRMKEYEREKRLLERKDRLERKANRRQAEDSD